MVESWKIQRLEEDLARYKQDNERMKDQLSSLESEIKSFVAERNQLIGMGRLARVGIKAIFALGGYGLFRAIHDVGHWMNTPWKAH